jgi:hypothetical protein
MTTTATCSCGESRPHVVARRTTADGVSVEVWDNGAITGRFGFKLEGVPIARPRTQNAVDLARRAGQLFAGEVCIHDAADLGALYEACRWAAARDGLPGTVRARLAALQAPTLTPVWTVVSTDRDGRPTCRYWRLPRLLSPGTVVWDHVSVGASGGRYEIGRVSPGDNVFSTGGIRFHTLSEVSAFILSERS